MDKDLLQRVLADAAEDSSPARLEALNQAYRDLRAEVAPKQKRFSALEERISDVDQVLSSLDQGATFGSDHAMLRRVLMDRRTRLIEEQEKINLGKLLKRIEDVKKEIENLNWTRTMLSLFEKVQTNG